MAERYPKRKLSTEDISRALNFDSDSDDSNDKLEKLLGEDSGSDIEWYRFECAYCISSWGKETIQMWNMWWSVWVKTRVEWTHCLSSWGRKSIST